MIDLPEDIWRAIFARSSVEDVVTYFRLTCHEWKDWADEVKDKVKVITLKGSRSCNIRQEYGVLQRPRPRLDLSSFSQVDTTCLTQIKVLILDVPECDTRMLSFHHFLAALQFCNQLVILRLFESPVAKSTFPRSFALPPNCRAMQTNLPLGVKLTKEQQARIQIWQSGFESYNFNISHFIRIQILVVHIPYFSLVEEFLRKVDGLQELMDVQIVICKELHLKEALCLTRTMAAFVNLKKLLRVKLEGISYLREFSREQEMPPALQNLCVTCRLCSFSALESLLALKQTSEISIMRLTRLGLPDPHLPQDTWREIPFNNMQNSALHVLSINTSSLFLKLNFEELMKAPVLNVVQIGCGKIDLGFSNEQLSSELREGCIQKKQIEFCCTNDHDTIDKTSLQSLGFDTSVKIISSIRGRKSNVKIDVTYNTRLFGKGIDRYSFWRVMVWLSRERSYTVRQWPQEITYDYTPQSWFPAQTEIPLLTAPPN